MDLLFEILVEFLVEGTIEISKNKKVPKMIRYPLITLIVVLFTGVIFLIFLIGVLAYYQRTSKIVGLFFILIGILFLIASIVKFYKVYLKKKRSNNNL